MVDMAMCRNKKCPVREKCYRYTAKANKYWQSYTNGEYTRKNGCELFIPNEERDGKSQKGEK